MSDLNIIIADDEPIARDILQEYTSKLQDVNVVGVCKNALEVFSLLSKEKVDMLLLDINMPEITGIELLKTLREPPLVIFTTAYAEYAVESYELNALDYLLKPISFDRFVTAINKAKDYKVKVSDSSYNDDKSIFIKSDGKLVKVELAQLILIEALKDYVKLHTIDKAIIVHSTMKYMEGQLSSYQSFIRVHKSYIVNVGFVEELEGNMLKLKEHRVVVGSTYKDKINDIIGRNRLI